MGHPNGGGSTSNLESFMSPHSWASLVWKLRSRKTLPFILQLKKIQWQIVQSQINNDSKCKCPCSRRGVRYEEIYINHQKFRTLISDIKFKDKKFWTKKPLKFGSLVKNFGQNKFWTKVSDVFYAFRTKLVMNKSHLNNCMRVSVRQLLLD